jgi:hypothetical protein
MTVEQYNSIFEQAYSESLVALTNGKSRKAMIEELMQRGFSYELANQIVEQAYRTKKSVFRQAGVKAFFVGIAFIILGIVITAATYSIAKPGGTFIVTIGLFFSGAINILRGLFRILVG